MNVAKKVIRRLGLHGSLRGLAALRHHREHALASRLIQDIQGRGFDSVVTKHKDARDSSAKYMNLSWHVEEVVREAGRLGLLRSAPLRVLDIGCGSGCFLFALKSCGHQVLGLDLPDNPIYNDLVDILEVPRVTHRVEAFVPLPSIGEFDLITAFSICFDLHWSDDVWGPAEWQFFLQDCLVHLRPRGRAFLNFNPALTRDFEFVPDSVAAFLRGMPRATLSGSKEYFTLRQH